LKAGATAAGISNADDIDLAINFFGNLETSLETCSGACAKPLFGISRDVGKGPVQKECVENIVDTLESLMGPGIVCLLTFFILLCACCGGFPLCCGFNEDDLETG